ncbi:YbaB/EbfC family nucleoid-associated protein [Streptomyces liangshanensis]|uniref:YbaB/EbfC family nucleoid-associated protein n=1 Tax=Streptomyces liangshanensis TaxID=2717324 RepID=UPI0036DF3DEF
MSQLLQQAQQMQAGLLAAQRELTELAIEGSAGGGAVRVTVDGALQLKHVFIAPEAADPNDTEHLARLILTATENARASARETATNALLPAIADTLTHGIRQHLDPRHPNAAGRPRPTPE